MEMPAAPEGEQPLCHTAALRPRSTSAKLCSCIPAERTEPLLPGSEERVLGTHSDAGSATVRTFFRHLRWVLAVLGCPQPVCIPGSCFLAGGAKTLGSPLPNPDPAAGCGHGAFCSNPKPCNKAAARPHQVPVNGNTCPQGHRG